MVGGCFFTVKTIWCAKIIFPVFVQKKLQKNCLIFHFFFICLLYEMNKIFFCFFFENSWDFFLVFLSTFILMTRQRRFALFLLQHIFLCFYLKIKCWLIRVNFNCYSQSLFQHSTYVYEECFSKMLDKDFKIKKLRYVQ